MPALGRARRRGGAAALALAGLLAFTGGAPAGAQAPAAAPAPQVPGPQGPLSGPQVIVRETAGAPVASLELWFRAPSAGFDAKQTPGLARLAAQVVSASKPIVGDSLDHIVGDLGGRLMISAFSDAVSVTAIVPSGGARRVLGAMTRAYFSPVISDDGYRDAARAVAVDAAIQSFNSEVVGRDAVFAALFATGPKVAPPGGEPQGIGSIELDAGSRVREARVPRAERDRRRDRPRDADDLATAVAAGRPSVDPASATAEPPLPSDLAAVPATLTRKLEDTGGALGWAGPPIRSEREATALDFVADYLFRTGSGTIAAPLADREPTANVIGQFITLRDPGVFLVTYTSAHSDELRAADRGGARRNAKAARPSDVRARARRLHGAHLDGRADGGRSVRQPRLVHRRGEPEVRADPGRGAGGVFRSRRPR